MPPLQKRALYSAMLLTGLILGFGILFFLFVEWLPVYAVLMAATSLGLLLVRHLTRRGRGHLEVEMDERDRMILSEVPKYQNTAVMLTLVAWGGVLLLYYDYHGEVPTRLAILMLSTVAAVNYLSIPLCTFIAYWRTK
jgi:hypothetical protein